MDTCRNRRHWSVVKIFVNRIAGNVVLADVMEGDKAANSSERELIF